MTPQITSWADFAHVSEESGLKNDEFKYTMSAVINSDPVMSSTIANYLFTKPRLPSSK